MMKKKIKRNRSKPILILLAFLLLTAQSFAQTDQRKITGTVTDVTTGQPVASASIVVKGRKNAVVSDENGKFAITAKAGENLEITSVGHVSKILKIEAGTHDLDIRLDQS